MSDKIIEITGDNFDRIKEENENLIIDCWAEWCGPCKMIAPIVDQLAEDYDGKVAFGKLDCDQNGDFVRENGIMAIPTLLFFKAGEEVERVIGVVSREELEEKMRQLL